MLKKLLSLALSAIMVMGMGTTAFAAEAPDGAPIEGGFVYDEAYAAEIAEKEALARSYDNARKTNNNIMAKSILNEINASANNTQPVLKSGSLALNSSDARLAIFQVAQERNYWCGYAAMKSLLDFEGVIKTQLQIAQQTYKENDALAWYTINGSEKSQFPSAVKLQELTGFNYIPYPYGAAGGTNVQASDIDYKIRNTINAGHGVMICGRSYGNIPGHASILPGYPASEIGHWIASDGYKDDAASIWIIDPAKSSVISWSNNISAYYEVTATKLAAFAKSRGIIW